MENTKFNPNQVAVANGNYFGMPYSVDEAPVVLISIPWDVTTSYRPGTANAPKAIINASSQLDFFDFDVVDAWKIGIATMPVDPDIEVINNAHRSFAESVITLLENGGDPITIANKLILVNEASRFVNNKIYNSTVELLKKGKLVGLVGGDHSIPYGFIQALSETQPEFGILHIDAHADLRDAYEGFTHSHASIMFNAIKLKGVTKLIQVAVRDECEDEVNLITNNEKIVQYDDCFLAAAEFEGKTWSKQCAEIISKLPERVYISFDIDGLSPEYCPNTGTPVPGGLSFQKAVYLLKKVVDSGRTIIGFDVSEVAPGYDEWDANVGARIIYKLCNLMYLSHSNSVAKR